MTRLLCHLGIHRPIWVPAIPYSQALPSSTFNPPVRRCRYCNRPLGRTHRE